MLSSRLVQRPLGYIAKRSGHKIKSSKPIPAPVDKGEQSINIFYQQSSSVHSLFKSISQKGIVVQAHGLSNESSYYNTNIKQSFVTTAIRSRCQPLSSGDIKKAVDGLTDQFMEARELLEDARESVGSVYFSEDMQEAKTAVSETLQYYENLLKQLSPEQKQDVLRTIGLKMEELKAQEAALQDEASH